MKLKALTWTTSCTPVLQIQGLTATFPMPDTSTKTAATRKYIVGGLLPFPPQSNHPLCGERFSLGRHFSVPPPVGGPAQRSQGSNTRCLNALRFQSNLCKPLRDILLRYQAAGAGRSIPRVGGPDLECQGCDRKSAARKLI